MMTLEEAIKHCEEVAEELDNECEHYEIAGIGGTGEQRKCASEHRQLAEWLRALKEIWDSGDCNDCLHSKNCTIRPQLGQLVRYNCYQYERRIDEEVNADETSLDK